MKIGTRNSGLTIGAIFTAASLLLTFTFFVPMISVLPGVFFEAIAKNLINNEPYSNVGKLTIFLLSIMFLLTLILSLIWVRHIVIKDGQISKGHIIIIMLVMYFIVHSLGFYIYWGLALDYRSDGQLIFGAVVSFPISSFAFIFIGLLVDNIKNRSWATAVPHDL